MAHTDYGTDTRIGQGVGEMGVLEDTPDAEIGCHFSYQLSVISYQLSVISTSD
ncbi:MAG: hypothetical protein SWX82_09770 [Cyanobacteriota bacterium]|nr:hypothetical protein [Cyanobacteriota bacterium]